MLGRTPTLPDSGPDGSLRPSRGLRRRPGCGFGGGEWGQRYRFSQNPSRMSSEHRPLSLPLMKVQHKYDIGQYVFSPHEGKLMCTQAISIKATFSAGKGRTIVSVLEIAAGYPVVLGEKVTHSVRW